MDILILDLYPKTSYRISKDQNGAFGTANNYGDSFVSRILKYLVKNSIDFPPLYSVQTCGELINSGHKVSFSKELNLEKKYDLYILPSSIVCHETEIEYLLILKKNNNASLVFYDKEEKIQLRVKVECEINNQNSTTKESWKKTQHISRRCYLTDSPPGTMSENPTETIPSSFRNLFFITFQ